MPERPQWPVFGDGPAHLDGDEHGIVEAGTASENPIHRMFALRPDQNGVYPPPGSFELRSDLTPEDLQPLGLTPGQAQRVIEAIKHVHREMPNLRLYPFAQGFGNLDDKLKEDAVGFIEAFAVLTNGHKEFREELEQKARLRRQQRMNFGWGVDPRLN